ncbi:MAG: hypothetical protein WC758_04325 [Candidatus Woesearchaeota archaeon]|jgi:hypothetical protein
MLNNNLENSKSENTTKHAINKKEHDKLNQTSNEEREYLINVMRECIDDARIIVQEKRLLENQAVLATIASSLFNARTQNK